jgi:hypothetical protein
LYTCGQQLNRIPASIQALLINVKDSAIWIKKHQNKAGLETWNFFINFKSVRNMI